MIRLASITSLRELSLALPEPAPEDLSELECLSLLSVLALDFGLQEASMRCLPRMPRLARLELYRLGSSSTVWEHLPAALPGLEELRVGNRLARPRAPRMAGSFEPPDEFFEAVRQLGCLRVLALEFMLLPSKSALLALADMPALINIELRSCWSPPKDRLDCVLRRTELVQHVLPPWEGSDDEAPERLPVNVVGLALDDIDAPWDDSDSEAYEDFDCCRTVSGWSTVTEDDPEVVSSMLRDMTPE